MGQRDSSMSSKNTQAPGVVRDVAYIQSLGGEA